MADIRKEVMGIPTAAEILATPMPDNDIAAETIQDYLIELLITLWREEESFSGKRPFGNSGWKGVLDYALIKAGYVTGVIDDNDEVADVDTDAVDELILRAIEHLGAVEP